MQTVSKKGLEISQNELRKSREKQRNQILAFVFPFNPNNPPDDVLKTIDVLKRINAPEFVNIKLINSKWQPPKPKNLLTNANLDKEEVVLQNANSRSECYDSLLLSNECTIRNVNKTFTLKTTMSYNSLYVIYVVICSGCLEYIGETGVGKTRLRDRVRVYRQHIKQLEHTQLKVEEHIRICWRGPFKILQFLQMQSNGTDLRRAYETKSQKACKTKLNQLWQVKNVIHRFIV